MQIVADTNISLLPLFYEHGEVRIYQGHEICAAHLKDADILLVRSQTRVDEKLLSGSNIKFVGSATSGTNHIDKQYLRQQGVNFVSAGGSNAHAVVNYVIAAMRHLALRYDVLLDKQTYGIVGMGHVGTKLYQYLMQNGAPILIYDPFVDNTKIPGVTFVALDELLAKSDVISLHTPLTLASKSLWPSYHLINHDTLALLKTKAWLINTSRGDIIDEVALLNFIRRASDVAVVLDVFATEPVLRHELVQHLDLASCHIAGYGKSAKENASLMILAGMIKYLYKPSQSTDLQPARDYELDLSDTIGSAYDILADDAVAREIASLPSHQKVQAFYNWRKNYKLR
ncbi:4-phosphoerythronate dehydrogenase [Gammaproteobacteria bacterium]|nr:4-phosphoerythronate dehydrogenase [Gammaproteobacteria bacterium]